MTCWRRLRDWQAAGVWYALYQLLLSKLDNAGKIDWERAAVDATFARALGGVEGSGPNPTDRGRPGVKQHLLVDAEGLPVAGVTTAANVPDVKELVPLVDAAGPQLPAGGPIHSMRIEHTTRRNTAASYEGVGSIPTWPDGGQSMGVGWGCFGGWSNAPSPGSTASANSASSPRNTMRCSSLASTLPLHLSLSDTYTPTHSVRASKLDLCHFGAAIRGVSMRVGKNLLLLAHGRPP